MSDGYEGWYFTEPRADEQTVGVVKWETGLRFPACPRCGGIVKFSRDRWRHVRFKWHRPELGGDDE